jgi:predicted MFS family arabinose efflux permease
MPEPSPQPREITPPEKPPVLNGGESPRIDPSMKRWAVVVLTLMLFTATMDFMVLMPLGPKLMALFSLTPKKFSFLVSSYSFAAGIFGFAGSFVFDRLDRKHALLGAYLGFILGTLVCAWAPDFQTLLFARALSGAFGGLLSGISFAIIGDVFSISERGLATGKLLTSYSLASILGVPIGLIVANHLGWHATFGSIAIVGIFAWIGAYRIIPNARWHLDRQKGSPFAGLTENLFDRNARTALGTTLLMVHSQFVVIPFISAYIVSNTGFPAFRLPHVYLIGGALTVVTGIKMGRICDQFGARKVFQLTGLLFLVPIYFITHLGHVEYWITLLTTTAIFVLSSLRSVPAVTLISSSIPAHRRGSFMSLNSCVHQVGAASATFLSGWFVTQNGLGNEMKGFADTAWLSIAFGIGAYVLGQRIKVVS